MVRTHAHTLSLTHTHIHTHTHTRRAYTYKNGPTAQPGLYQDTGQKNLHHTSMCVCVCACVCVCVLRSRCTGYRPILDAFRVFAKVDPKAYTEEAIAAAKGLPHGANGHANGHTNGSTNGICPSSGMPCDCKLQNGGCNGAANGNGHAANGNGCGAGDCGVCAGTGMVPTKRPPNEPIFPPELKGRAATLLHMPGEHWAVCLHAL